jgi:hypothetical protein
MNVPKSRDVHAETARKQYSLEPTFDGFWRGRWRHRGWQTIPNVPCVFGIVWNMFGMLLCKKLWLHLFVRLMRLKCVCCCCGNCSAWVLFSAMLRSLVSRLNLYITPAFIGLVNGTLSEWDCINTQNELKLIPWVSWFCSTSGTEFSHWLWSTCGRNVAKAAMGCISATFNS